MKNNHFDRSRASPAPVQLEAGLKSKVIPLKKRILIADFEPMMLDALREHINQQHDMVVCGEASSTASLRKAAIELRPDLVVMCLLWESGDGLDLIKSLVQEMDHLAILVFSRADENLYTERVLRAGAHGYLSKNHSSAELLAAMRSVMAGDIAINPAIAAQLVHRALERPLRTSPSEPAAGVEKLSDRELTVFQMTGAGKSSSNIAEALCISIKTVETHKEHIKHKLNLPNAASLARRAREWVENAMTAPSVKLSVVHAQ